MGTIPIASGTIAIIDPMYVMGHDEWDTLLDRELRPQPTVVPFSPPDGMGMWAGVNQLVLEARVYATYTDGKLTGFRVDFAPEAPANG